MASICEVKKEVYMHLDQPHVAPCVSVGYAGQTGLKRVETVAFEATSDWMESGQRRCSEDNGRTWSDWEPITQEQLHPTQGEWKMSQGEPGGGVPDSAADVRFCRVFQRLVRGDPGEALHLMGSDRDFFDHVFYCVSRDGGASWSDMRLLRYEQGPDFDPENWDNPEYLRTNEMYPGNLMPLPDGGMLVIGTAPVPYADPRDEGIPLIFPSNYREGCVAAVLVFLGRWNEAGLDYDWSRADPLFLPRHVSSRGLVEVELTRLRTGDLMMVMRGSNASLDPAKAPGRKWVSVSKDDGRSWSPLSDLRYDTGEQFYSPSSIHHFLRRKADGKLYWLANITEGPTEGNHPRYPLQITEVDEETATIKKDTVTVIDDRDPQHDSPHVQMSNFCILEDRETDNVELYLTRIGEHGAGPKTVWTADAYKYTLTF